MDKSQIISKFASNQEERVLLAHIYDLYLRSVNRNMVVSSNFLSEAEASKVQKMLECLGITDYCMFGGYEEAERKCCVFFTDYFTKDDIMSVPSACEIEYLQIEVDKYDADRAELTHRDCLGAIMSLGIEREMIGDILTDKASALVMVKSKIAEYVSDEIKSIGRHKVEVKLTSSPRFYEKSSLTACSDTVASMRFDAIVSSVFNVSRSEAADVIEKGNVTVNGVVTEKVTYKVCENDRIAFHGKGRIIIKSIDGASKKGRIRFTYMK